MFEEDKNFRQFTEEHNLNTGQELYFKNNYPCLCVEWAEKGTEA